MKPYLSLTLTLLVIVMITENVQGQRYPGGSGGGRYPGGSGGGRYPGGSGGGRYPGGSGGGRYPGGSGGGRYPGGSGGGRYPGGSGGGRYPGGSVGIGNQCACTYNYQPVCGSNGRTYSNSCQLNCERRRNPYLRLQYHDRCRSGGGGQWGGF